MTMTPGETGVMDESEHGKRNSFEASWERHQLLKELAARPSAGRLSAEDR
jgi:hypothetical protein